jgi:tetratricopeptide (TPR) repeat protein
MKIHFKQKFQLLITAIIVLTLSLNCAHKKAYKKALEFEKAGKYVESAEKDLEALDKKPEYTDAKTHLTFIAPKAYEELLSRSENYEKNNQWIEAAGSWKHLDILLGRMQRHQVILTTVDVKSRISQANEKGTNYYYSTASGYFQRGQFQEAVDLYQKVLQLSSNYLDTRQKLWEGYSQLGDRKLQAKDYAAAISDYQSALEFADNKTTTNTAIAEAYYRWAEDFTQRSNFREATERYESALAVVPNYRDAEQRRKEVYEKAVKRVAVLPFKNSTSLKADYSNLLTDLFLNECIKANLKYTSFIDRENLALILEEHKLAMAGVVDPEKATEIGKLEGIHYLITGTISQISQQNTPATFTDKTFEKTYTEKDTAGKDVQKIQLLKYKEYKASRSIQMTVSFQIIDVATGKYITGDTFSENNVDQTNWIRYSGNLNDLPRDKRNLIDQPSEPKSADLLINEGIQTLSDKMSKKVQDFFK